GTGKKSYLGNWKQRHWDIDISAHEGQGYEALARALREGPAGNQSPYDRVVLVFWNLNDCVFEKKTTKVWH
ncbi:hypothetical protein, partial [Escherichia coli]|uniref:hypothetical protein n=1 Tax=Escherichia coli TaxID=562 RepID=UPI0027396424